MRILLGAGGTAGHLLAARSLFAALVEGGMNPSEIAFVTADRALDYELIPEGEFEVLRYRGHGLSRSLRGMPTDLVGTIKATFQLAPHVLRGHPKVAVGFGGFVALGSLALARLGGARIVTVEQNAVFGRANQILQPIVSRNALALPIEAGPTVSRRSWLIGGIVRPEVESLALMDDPKRWCREQLGIDPHERLIAVAGGSLGARVLNQSVPRLLELLEASGSNVPIRVAHFGGSVNDLGSFDRSGSIKYQHFGFDPDLYRWLCAADLVVSRAGASTIAELCALGVGSILVPIAGSSRDHQGKNAAVLSRVGAARVLQEGWLSSDRYLQQIVDVACNDESCRHMAAAAKALFRPGSTERLASMVAELAG